MSIFAGVCTIQIVFTLPETYAPIILVEKAKRLRKETGNQSYYAPLEKQDKVNFSKRLEHILARPFVLLFQEPMLAAITVYMSFVYGCLYVLFEAYPIVFAMGHHFNAGISGLMFLPLLLGGLTAVITVCPTWMIYSAVFTDLLLNSIFSSSTLATLAPWRNTHLIQCPLNFAWKLH